MCSYRYSIYKWKLESDLVLIGKIFLSWCLVISNFLGSEIAHLVEVDVQ